LAFVAKDLRQNENFEFSFLIEEEGQYSFCFAHDGELSRMVEIDYHYEIENEYAPTEMIDRASIDPMLAKSQHLAERAERLKFEFDHSVEREHVHRDTNGNFSKRNDC